MDTDGHRLACFGLLGYLLFKCTDTANVWRVNLEDHLGDVIRKARTMSTVSPAQAASAAGLSESELGTLEESGQPPRKPNFAALGTLLGLHPAKLEQLAGGWSPSP